MINLMIVEDHEIVRQGLSQMLALEPGISIIGEAVDGQDAMEQIEKGTPVDIMTVDWNMPRINGLDLTQWIKIHRPVIKVIILTMHSKEDYRKQALDAGAAAYLLKDLDTEEIAKVIRDIYYFDNTGLR